MSRAAILLEDKSININVIPKGVLQAPLTALVPKVCNLNI